MIILSKLIFLMVILLASSNILDTRERSLHFISALHLSNVNFIFDTRKISLVLSFMEAIAFTVSPSVAMEATSLSSKEGNVQLEFATFITDKEMTIQSWDGAAAADVMGEVQYRLLEHVDSGQFSALLRAVDEFTNVTIDSDALEVLSPLTFGYFKSDMSDTPPDATSFLQKGTLGYNLVYSELIVMMIPFTGIAIVCLAKFVLYECKAYCSLRRGERSPELQSSSDHDSADVSSRSPHQRKFSSGGSQRKWTDVYFSSV